MKLVYITCKDKHEAVKISKLLLDNKLAACTNFFPISSMYWWEGKLNNDDEFVVIAKTKAENYDKIKEEVKKVHSYDIPCILCFDADANEEYVKWVDDNLEN